MLAVVNDALMVKLVAAMGVWFTAVTIPGPNFFLTSYTAMTRSHGEGVATAFGVGFGTSLWTVVALLGVGLLLDNPLAMDVARLCGSLYFVYLGLRMLCSAGEESPAVAGFSRSGLYRAFCRGVLSELMSVHRMPFLASLFAMTLPAHHVPVWFFGLLVLATVLIAILWYSLVAALAAAGPLRRADRLRPMLCRLAGIALVTLGVAFSPVVA